MIVWMSSLKRGVSYHPLRPDQRFTVCGKPVGRGHMLPIVRAVDDFAARVCRLCSGDGERRQPNVVPSRDRVR